MIARFADFATLKELKDHIMTIGLHLWGRAATLGKIIMAEMRGEDFLPNAKLNQMTLDIADVLERHGYPVRYNESHNALRLLLGKDYFQEWLGFTLEDDAFTHTHWDVLREDRKSSPLSKAAKGTAFWVWSKIKFHAGEAAKP